MIRKRDRIIESWCLEKEIINIISVYAPQVGNVVVVVLYAPQVGLGECIKVQFHEYLEDVVRKISIDEKIFIGGNLNEHVGYENKDYNEIHGGFSFGNMNNERSILDFAIAYDLFSQKMDQINSR